MDNRRMSARADIGATRSGRSYPISVPFLDRAIELTRVNWELIFFVSLMLIVIFTRLWNLGDRALHHDESIHAYFSNLYMTTGNYTSPTGPFQGGYDPTYHGPLLYTATALAFFLFGTSDAIARLMPAFFGIALVGMCWLLRPFIGRIGAMVAAVLLMLSPSISYYSRSLRHDIFALTGIMLMFISILWFLRTHRAKWFYLLALGLIIAFASHELIYIVAFIFVLFLALTYFLYPRMAERATAYSDQGYLDDEVLPIRSALSSLLNQKWTIVGGLLLFLGIYVVLFTNMLTKPQLILSGFTESLGYWLTQQNVARGTQPWFYYFLMTFIYEPLAIFAGLGTIIYMIVKYIRGEGGSRHSDDIDVAGQPDVDDYGFRLPSISSLRGLTLAFLAFWSIAAFIAFSSAGEKMPWLTMEIALPFSLLAAGGLGRLIAGIDWRQAWKGGAAFLAITVFLFIFAAFAFISFLNGSMPAPTGSSADLQKAMRGVLLFLIVAGLLALAGWLSYKMLPGRAIKIVGLTFVLLLTAYGFRSMTLLNYSHPDVPIEMMIYTQSAPDTVIVSDMLHRLSRDETAFDTNRNANDPTGGHGLTIAIDQNDATEWPFDWYLRDMKALSYFNPNQWAGSQNGLNNAITPNEAVIIASTATENDPAFQNFIKGKYSTNEYVLNWWFPEEGTYKKNNEGDLGTAISWLMGNGMKYLLYRDPGPGNNLGSRNFYLHIRNDLAPKVGLAPVPGAQQTTPPSGTNNNQPPQNNGPAAGLFDMASGSGNGQFSLPRGIAVGPDGNIYVVDTGNMRIQKFDPKGKFLAVIGSGSGNGDGQFAPLSADATGTGPGGIAVDKAGNIYVADTWNHRIQKFDSSGKFVKAWGSFINLSDPASANDADPNSKFYGPRGIAIGPDGNVYVTDTGNKRVLVFDPNGSYVKKIDSGMSPTRKAPDYAFNKPGEMNEPIGIAVDGAGNVYVADSLNRRIQKFDTSGKPLAQWPIPINGWSPGAYLEPFLALDSAGNLYATAPTGGSVIKFNPTGQVVSQQKTAGAITLKTPTGIAVAQDGTVYVVDTGSNGVVNMGQMK